MLALLQLESGFLLGVDHVVIAELVVDVVDIMRDICLGCFFIQMIERILFAGNESVVLFGPFFFGGQRFFGIFVIFNFAGSFAKIGMNLFVEDRIKIIIFFSILNGGRFF